MVDSASASRASATPPLRLLLHPSSDAERGVAVVGGGGGAEPLQQPLDDVGVHAQGDRPHEEAVDAALAVLVPRAVPAGWLDAVGAQLVEIVGEEVALAAFAVGRFERRRDVVPDVQPPVSVL